MRRARLRRVLGICVVAAIVLSAVVLWKFTTFVRLGLSAAAAAVAHVHASVARLDLSPSAASLRGVRITSWQGQPIATIDRIALRYDLHDLIFGGKRRYGLESIELYQPHLSLVRYPDGSYNVPALHFPSGGKGAAAPLHARLRVVGGSAIVEDRSRNAQPGLQTLYVRDFHFDGQFQTDAQSHYLAAFEYGEDPGRLFAVHGRGTMDAATKSMDQHWTANGLPIAGAVDFLVNSPSLHLRAGTLTGVDARYFTFGGNGRPHLAATGFLTGGKLAVAGLAVPVEAIAGPVDAYDDGLLTSRLHALLGGVPVTVNGGIYDLHDPRVRIAVRGNGDIARLRRAFTAARRLPIDGLLGFAVLVEGRTNRPTTWVDLRSPSIAYASMPVRRIGALVALTQSEADVVRFNGSYGGAALEARGRFPLRTSADRQSMLVAVNAPAGALPSAASFLPAMPLHAIALARATGPKAFAVSGTLWGNAPAERIAGLFDMDERGTGTLGPIYASGKQGSLYARIALDRPNGRNLAFVTARNFVVPSAHGRLDADLFGNGDRSGMVADARATLRGAWGVASANGRATLRRGSLDGVLTGNVSHEAAFAAALAGTPASPRVDGTVVVANGKYRNFNVNGNAGLSYAGGTLEVRDAAVALGPIFVGVAGTIEGVSPHRVAPRYDLATEIHTSDVKTVLAAVQPHAASIVDGSLDADMRVRGASSDPSFEGTVSAPEGSVNGLAFRDMTGVVRGDRFGGSVSDGRVLVGSTKVSLGAAVAPDSTHVAVSTAHTDLADFNDLFDAGDTFAGTGSLAMDATLHGKQVVSTAGRANFTQARFRRLDLGTVAARWHSSGNTVATDLAMGGPSGELRVNGDVAAATRELDVIADARGVDLGTWLPMLGMRAPITGKLDARTHIAGRYPDVAMSLRAAVHNGTLGRLPLQRLELTASALHGRGRIESAVVSVPSLTTTASGTFGLRKTDPIALVAHSTSPNVGAFMVAATGKDLHLGGSLDSTLHLRGTPLAPYADDRIVLQSLQYGNLVVPRVAGDVVVTRRDAAIRNGEVDLTKGRALLSASMPIQMTAAGVRPGRGPVTASLTGDDVELSDFASLLPKNSQLAGRIDGSVAVSGRATSPQLAGSLTLRDGTVRTAMLRSPLDRIDGVLTFAGRQARLRSQASAGAGTLALTATASLDNLLQPARSTVTAQLRAVNAGLDLSPYFKGELDGALALQRTWPSPPVLSGDATLSKARISVAAFLAGHRGNGGSALPQVAFDNVRLAAGSDVRVQSANVDVGTMGSVTLAGTLAKPTLSGSFHSTGGTLSLYRSFNLESAFVRFAPSAGIVPDVNAVATTFVTDPATAIRLHVTGPVTGMHLALASQPEYSRQQILGILVGAQQIGAVQGVRASGGGMSASSAATNLALGQVDTYFTRSFLEPLSSSVAGAFGLSSVQLTAGVQSGVGVSAVKAFGKTVSAIFSQTFGYPKTESIALEAHPSVATGLRLTAYTSQGPTLLSLQQPQAVGLDVLNVSPLTSFTPQSGTNGVSFTFQKKFP